MSATQNSSFSLQISIKLVWFTCLVSVNHWWKAFACFANSFLSLSFSSCRWASFANSISRSWKRNEKKKNSELLVGKIKVSWNATVHFNSAYSMWQAPLQLHTVSGWFFFLITECSKNSTSLLEYSFPQWISFKSGPTNFLLIWLILFQAKSYEGGTSPITYISLTRYVLYSLLS